MKKILFGLLLTVLLVPMMVSAALVPYIWIVDGEEISAQDSTNTAGTAKIHKDGYLVTLTLNNYKGGPLKEECRGTGVAEIEFKIVLEGENTITSDNIGIELDTIGKEITFEGNGTLTIKAPKPLSYSNSENEMVINPSGTLKEEHSDNAETPISENEKEENLLISKNETEEDLLIDENKELIAPKEEKTNYILPIVIGVCAFIIGCLSGTLISKKKKTEEKPL